MQHDFWHQRWHDNQIGFHQDTPTPLMLKHWSSLGIASDTRVFVPLAGKTLDMAWFAAQGHRVLGVELSRIAVEAFFAEQGVTAELSESKYGTHYCAGNIELICGDAFGLDEAILSDCGAVFDRAALIALPADLRRRYVHELYARLPSHCRGLLVSLEYPQHEKDGPPFSVVEDEVRELYSRDWDITTLERRDILATQQKFIDEGVTALDTVVYALRRKLT
ncbi:MULTISPECIES: thiopurine S-methyltransferase [unclassified Lysobacter]|uniref:thiopurine S-methyltransferase n=1 Tax=unclassified Lysobacter TaxID=2635362 RepID=UPI001C214976|nr:thiopurine S-methyltransferase [Lysobacter sp. MMG2]MBU8975019.1 thiopurine S-methyltransferase [Lysobacter sp. MMG2]